MKQGERIELLLRDVNGRFYPAWIRCDALPYYTITLSASIVLDGTEFKVVDNNPPPPPLNSYQFSDATDDFHTICIQAASLEEAIKKKLNPPIHVSYSASSSAGALQIEDLSVTLSAAIFDPAYLRLTYGRT